MGVKDTANLALIPAAYKTSKVYSALPTDGDGDFTFTRSGSGTRINKAGLIETMATNVPRLNYRLDADGNPSSCPELLLEPESANLLQRSEDYANSYWLKARVGSNATGYTAPDGTKNATYFEQQSGQTTAAVIYKSAFTSASSGIYTFSIWAKKAEKRYLKLQTRVNSATYRTVFDLEYGDITYDSGNENAKIEAYPNGWYRLSVQRTSTTTDDIIVYYYLNDSAGSSDTVTDSGGLYIWGSQVEKKDILTSYIPTTTAQITRNKDEAEINNFADAPTGYPFTMYVNMRVETGVTGYGMSFGWDATSNYYYSIGYSEDSGNLRKFRFTNRGSGNSYNFNTTAEYYEGNHKLAVKFLSSTNFIAYINGIEVVNYTHTASAFNSNIQDVLVGQLREVTDTNDRTPIKEAFIFNKALTDAEMVEITSYTSFTEMATQQQYTIQ